MVELIAAIGLDSACVIYSIDKSILMSCTIK